MGLTLVLAGAPISGSPHLVAMTGNDPAAALRQLILGTALLPLTILPVFWLIRTSGSPLEVARAAGGLLVLIGASAGLAFAVRVIVLRDPSVQAVEAIDGLSALAMAVVVVGLMSAVGPALLDRPAELVLTLGLVFTLNIALQMAGTIVGRGWLVPRGGRDRNSGRQPQHCRFSYGAAGRGDARPPAVHRLLSGANVSDADPDGPVLWAWVEGLPAQLAVAPARRRYQLLSSKPGLSANGASLDRPLPMAWAELEFHSLVQKGQALEPDMEPVRR